MSLLINILLDALIAIFFGLLALVVVFFISLYLRGAFRRRSLLNIEHAIEPTDPHFVQALKSLAQSQSTTGRVVDFWDQASEIQQARITAIQSAQHSIHFETFIMTPGKRAQDFAAAIAQKAAEGVSVQVMVDSWGTRSLPKKYWQRLQLAGVQVVFFNPFDWRAPANYAGRTHRKMLIIDSKRVLVGGAGISDLWDGTEKEDDEKSWMDIEFALEGEVVLVMASIFQSHWATHREQGSNAVTTLDMSKIYPALANDVPSQPFYASTKTFKELTNNIATDIQQYATGQTQAEDTDKNNENATIVVTPGTKPSYRHSPIEKTKEILIACARERIWLASPYFLPNNDTRHLLTMAARVGVDVRILTTSSKSDKKPVYYASYEIYGSLLREGIQIFEYQPSMIHAKLLLIDNAWANTGSANLDYRSYLHNDELDIVTNSQKLIRSIEQVFERGFADSEQIGLKRWEKRSLLKHRILGNAVRLVQWQL